MACRKCNSGGRTSPTFRATATYISDPTAEVTVTESAYLDSPEGTRRLYLGETLKLQYGLIAELLRESCDVIYFTKRSELLLFLSAYPDLEGCAT